MSPGRWVQRLLTPPVACSGPAEGGRVSPHPDLGVAAGSGPGPKPGGGLCSHPRCASPSQTSELNRVPYDASPSCSAGKQRAWDRGGPAKAGAQVRGPAHSCCSSLPQPNDRAASFLHQLGKLLKWPVFKDPVYCTRITAARKVSNTAQRSGGTRAFRKAFPQGLQLTGLKHVPKPGTRVEP